MGDSALPLTHEERHVTKKQRYSVEQIVKILQEAKNADSAREVRRKLNVIYRLLI